MNSTMFKKRDTYSTATTRLVSRGFVIVAVVAVLATLTLIRVAAAPPQERDLFGTVVSVEDGVLVVSTSEGVVEIAPPAVARATATTKPSNPAPGQALVAEYERRLNEGGARDAVEAEVKQTVVALKRKPVEG